MKIAFVVPRFFPYRGGQENYVLKLGQQLHLQGHEVSVLTSTAFDLESFWIPGFRTLPAGRENVEGIEVRRLPISYHKWVRRAGRVLAYSPHWRWKARYSAPGFRVKGLSAALRKLRPDVIHIGPLPYTRIMYEALHEGLRCGARVIATPCVHFGEDNSSAVARYYTRDFQMRLLNECQAVLTMTDMERLRLAEMGVDGRKLRTTAHGIDIEEVMGGDAERFRRRWNLSGPIVVQLGTKTEDKGTIAVVEAMKSLWAQGSKAWLVLAGASTGSFDEYISSQQNLPCLLNLAPVNEEEKRDLLAATDIMVHPSRVESLGIVYLEAWANAKPVIAADTAASRAVITLARDGLLVRFGDSAATADAIRQLLGDPIERQRLGAAGREKVLSKYSWDVILPKILDVFCGKDLDSEFESRPDARAVAR